MLMYHKEHGWHNAFSNEHEAMSAYGWVEISEQERAEMIQREDHGETPVVESDVVHDSGKKRGRPRK